MRISPWNGLQLDVVLRQDKPIDALIAPRMRCSTGKLQHPAVLFIVFTVTQPRRIFGFTIHRKRKYAIPVWVD